MLDSLDKAELGFGGLKNARRRVQKMGDMESCRCHEHPRNDLPFRIARSVPSMFVQQHSSLDSCVFISTSPPPFVCSPP
ncbi:MAG: hypothetical protein V3V76_03250 [Candidatus Adiutricales bacterium]